MKELFSQVVRPVATMETAEAFLGRCRLMSIDGMAWHIPGIPPNGAAFGYPPAGGGRRARSPKAQVVTVSECASSSPARDDARLRPRGVAVHAGQRAADVRHAAGLGPAGRRFSPEVRGTAHRKLHHPVTPGHLH